MLLHIMRLGQHAAADSPKSCRGSPPGSFGSNYVPGTDTLEVRLGQADAEVLIREGAWAEAGGMAAGSRRGKV